MKKIKLLTVLALFAGLSANISAQKNVTKYIKTYFTQAPDNSFSSGVKAVYCNNTIFDTLAAYINKAKYTIDIACYEYETWSGDPIYTAINNAYSRGVKVRFIQDNGYASKNTGVSKLNASIPVLTSPAPGSAPCGGSYNIMHNKFVIIDEYATADTTNTYVWTGSPDWDQAMSSGDYNNVIVFQSKVLARAYTNEFDIMWGDTTHGGKSSSSGKFGPCKPNSGTHKFTIGGSEVELYFSPSDSVNNHIVKEIETAQTDLYCGMFTFTETTDATDIVNEKKAGAFAAAILDNYSSGSYTPYTTILPGGLGSDFQGFVSSSYLYHNKYLIVNPSAPCQNPVVLTGSHNWTSSADAENDENTVIVHNDTIANQYLQAFAGDFKTISGSSLATTKNPCKPTGIDELATESQLDVFPNPYKGNVTISYTLAEDTKVTMYVYNIMGERVATLVDGAMLESGQHQFRFNGASSGVYILQVNEGGRIYTRKLIQE
jgi:hypothetical protein